MFTVCICNHATLVPEHMGKRMSADFSTSSVEEVALNKARHMY